MFQFFVIAELIFGASFPKSLPSASKKSMSESAEESLRLHRGEEKRYIPTFNAAF